RLLGARIIQHCLFRATVMVDAGHGAADRPIPARGGWKRGRIGRLRRRNGWNCFRRVGGYLLDHGAGYGPVFAMAGSFHVSAFIIILIAIPVVGPVLSRSSLRYEGV